MTPPLYWRKLQKMEMWQILTCSLAKASAEHSSSTCMETRYYFADLLVQAPGLPGGMTFSEQPVMPDSSNLDVSEILFGGGNVLVGLPDSSTKVCISMGVFVCAACTCMYSVSVTICTCMYSVSVTIIMYMYVQCVCNYMYMYIQCVCNYMYICVEQLYCVVLIRYACVMYVQCVCLTICTYVWSSYTVLC